MKYQKTAKALKKQEGRLQLMGCFKKDSFFSELPPLTRSLFISSFVFRVCFWLVRLLILFELDLRRQHAELFYSTTAILHRFYKRLSFLKHPNNHVGPSCFVKALVLRKQIQCSTSFLGFLPKFKSNQN